MFDTMQAVAEELVRRGHSAFVEGGGAACPFVCVEKPSGEIVLIGNANPTWGADVYPNMMAWQNGDDAPGVESDVPYTQTDPKAIADAFMGVIES